MLWQLFNQSVYVQIYKIPKELASHLHSSLKAKSTWHKKLKLEQNQINTSISINLSFPEHCQNLSFVLWNTLNVLQLHMNPHVGSDEE